MFQKIPDLAKLLNVYKNGLFLDVGGYRGDFTKYAVDYFDCRSVVYEPYAPYFEECKERFKDDKRISVLNLGWGKGDKIVKIYPHREGTSIFQDWHHVDENKAEEVVIHDAGKTVRTYGEIDAIKLNCEGAEYEIIESMYEQEVMKNVKTILIQFHSVKEARDIRPLLEKTHNGEELLKSWEIWRLHQ